MSYAVETEVPVEKSKAEIERMLMRAGASKFMSGFDAEEAIIMFALRGKTFKFVLPLPARTDRKFVACVSTRSHRPKEEQIFRAWEQACKSRWRVLALAIKAKLESVEIGLTTFEQEFLAFIVTDDGRTVGERIIPQLNAAAEGGPAPMLMLTLGGAAK